MDEVGRAYEMGRKPCLKCGVWFRDEEKRDRHQARCQVGMPTTCYEGYRIKHLTSGKFTVWGPMEGPGLGDPNGTVYSGLRCSEPLDSIEEAKAFIDRLIIMSGRIKEVKT